MIVEIIIIRKHLADNAFKLPECEKIIQFREIFEYFSFSTQLLDFK